MVFDSISLINLLDRPIAINTVKDFTTPNFLPPCQYDGVGEFPNILQQQYTVGTKISDYLDAPLTWPRRVYFDKLPKGVLGEADYTEKHIKYSNIIKTDPTLQKTVPAHEITHLQEEGLDEFLRMYSIYLIGDDTGIYLAAIPTGRIMVEGGTEVLLTKIDEPRNAYEKEFQLMKKIDKKTPVKNLFSIAKNYGSDKVWRKLYKSEGRELIDIYLLEGFKEGGLKNPVIIAKFDTSITAYN